MVSSVNTVIMKCNLLHLAKARFQSLVRSLNFLLFKSKMLLPSPLMTKKGKIKHEVITLFVRFTQPPANALNWVDYFLFPCFHQLNGTSLSTSVSADQLLSQISKIGNI